MPTIKTVFVLEDQVSPSLNNIGNVGNSVLSDIENAAAAIQQKAHPRQRFLSLSYHLPGQNWFCSQEV